MAELAARLNTGVEKVSLDALKGFGSKRWTSEVPVAYAGQIHVEMTRHAPPVFNAANEVAVAAFIEGEIGLMDIPNLIERRLGRGAGQFSGALGEIPDINLNAQYFCRSELSRRYQAGKGYDAAA